MERRDARTLSMEALAERRRMAVRAEGMVWGMIGAIQLYWSEEREYEDGTWYPQFHFGFGVGL